MPIAAHLEEDRRIGRVRHRLEMSFDPVAKRAERISSFINSPISSQDLTDRLDRNGETHKELVEDQLIGYLFNKLRDQFHKSERPYSEYFEKKQITSIIQLLDGDNLHVPTGYGKSSVILPIATIVHALTRSEAPILTTVNEQLITDLKRNVQSVVELLPNNPMVRPVIREVTKAEENIDEPKEKTFWKQILTTSNKQNPFMEQSFIPTIHLTDDHTLVFQTMSNRSVWGRLPWVYFDEAHVPFDRGSPYVTEGETEATREEKIAYKNHWLLTYLIRQKVTDNDFNQDEELPIIKDSTYTRIENDFIPDIVEQQIVQLSKSLPQKSILPNDLKQCMSWWNSLPQEERVEEIAISLGQLTKVWNFKNGKEYAYDAKGLPIPRDQYLGWLLPTHHFDKDIAMAISAKDGSYAVPPLAMRAGDVMHFGTFINRVLKGRMSAVSGTLFVGDLITRQPRLSPFGEILQKYTDGKVINIDWAPKNPPSPEIYDTDEKAINALMDQFEIKENKPTLICSWDVQEAKKIYEKLLKNPKFQNRVRIIDDLTSQEDVDLYYRTMEQQNTKDPLIIVTAGKASLGVDIKNPSLRVVLYNTPLSRQQIWQALGRARQGDDFSWFITEPAINDMLRYIESDMPILDRLILKRLSKDKVMDYLKSDDPQMRLFGVNYLFEQCEAHHRVDNEFYNDLETMYGDNIAKNAYGIIEEQVRRNLTRRTKYPKPLIDNVSHQLLLEHLFGDHKKSVDEIAQKLVSGSMNLPPDIYWTMFHELSSISNAQSMRDLLTNKLLRRMQGIYPAVLSSWVDIHLDSSIDDLKRILSYFDTAMNHSGINPNTVKQYISSISLDNFSLNVYCTALSAKLNDSTRDYFFPTSSQDYMYIDTPNGKYIFFTRNNNSTLITGPDGKPLLYDGTSLQNLKHIDMGLSDIAGSRELFAVCGNLEKSDSHLTLVN